MRFLTELRRTRAIAMQSIIAGMALSGVTMIAAAFGYVTPVAGALLQEAIDVAVILNALRALAPPHALGHPPMSEAAAAILREDHERLAPSLERLRQIADALDDAQGAEAVDYILEANRIIETVIARHEREDEATIYPRVSSYLKNGHGLSAMSCAHREILHQARLLGRLSDGLRPSDVEPYLVRDAQRIIESIESLVHIHNAQEEDIYEDAAAQLDIESQAPDKGPNTRENRGVTAFERALELASDGGRRWRMSAGVLVTLAFAAAGVYLSWDYFARLRQGAPEPESAWSEIMTAHITSDSTAIGVLTSGVIDVVFCDVGSIVKAGQVCAQIDARPYRFIVERGNVDLSLANGRLEKSRAHLARARAKYERNQSLFKRKAIALSALKVSQNALEQMRAEVADAEAAADLAQAALAAAQSNLEHTSIVSPIAGTVVARNVAVGQSVVAAQTEPLFRVAADPGTLKINVTADSRVAYALRLGDAVSVSLETDLSHPFVGRLTQISLNPKPSEANANYDVVITTTNRNLRLKPGMTTTIRIMPSGAHRPTKNQVSSSPS